MRNRKLIISLLWASLALSILNLVPVPLLLPQRPFLPLHVVSLALIPLLAAVGIPLLIFTLKSQFTKRHRIFLILTGSALIGIPFFAILHNLAYAISIKILGEVAWGNGDEPFFFILAVFVCPIAYLIGFVGSMVYFKKKESCVKQD